jgi:hypothetical protein
MRLLQWFRDMRRRRAESLLFEREVVVTENGESVTARFPDGESLLVFWRDLIRVEIRTNDSGPWGADVWWALIDGQHECVFPQGATGELDLIPKLQRLPGFDNEQFIKAMRCTNNATFVCWQTRSVA